LTIGLLPVILPVHPGNPILTVCGDFTVAHVGWLPAWQYFVLVFLTGIVSGWLRGRDGSLVAPFVAHGQTG